MKKLILPLGVLLLCIFWLPQESLAFCTDSIPAKYERAIEVLYEDGIIKGNKDGSCKPNDKINRIEFAVLTMRAAIGDEDAKDAQCKPGLFTDLDCGAWYAPYAAKAKELGIFTRTKLEPTKNVNMAEAAAIVIRTLFGGESSFSALTAKSGENWYDPFFRLFKANDVPLQSAGALITRGDMANILLAINYKSYHEIQSWLTGDAADTLKEDEDADSNEVNLNDPDIEVHQQNSSASQNNTQTNTQSNTQANTQPQYSGVVTPANSANSFRYMVENLEHMDYATIANVLRSLNSSQQLQLSIYSAFASWAHYLGCQADSSLVVTTSYGPSDCNATATSWQNTLQWVGTWDQALTEARLQQGNLLIGMKCATGEIDAGSCGTYSGLMQNYNNMSHDTSTQIINNLPSGGCNTPGQYLPDGSYCAPTY